MPRVPLAIPFLLATAWARAPLQQELGPVLVADECAASAGGGGGASCGEAEVGAREAEEAAALRVELLQKALGPRAQLQG